jgi:solute carrier family 25 protein 38
MAGGTSASINFGSGVVAAGLATAITNPFDSIKTRIQLRPREYRNMVQASRKMIAEDGFRSLFDGLAIRMARKAMSSALAWTLYEELIRRAELPWKEKEKEKSLS